MSVPKTYFSAPRKTGGLNVVTTNPQRFNGEWKTKRLGDLGDISGTGVDKKINVNEVLVRLVNYLDIYHKTFLYSKDLTHEVSAKPEHLRRCMVRKGDVFFTPTSEVRNDIGHSAVAMEDIPDGVYSYHVVRFRLKTDWDLCFRVYAFNTKRFLDQASAQCEGSGTRYVITLPKFRAMVVNFPTSVEEQRAIGEVLSDVDELLVGLETMISKKRAIKQATMQQLLTGKIRLPGFSGEWETKRFGDLLTYERPDSYIVQSTEHAKHGDVPVLTANKSFILHYTDEEFGVCNSIPVIVFDDFTTDCKYATFPFKVKSSAIKLLRARHDRVSLRYVYELMKLIRLPVGEHKRYYISEYQNIEFLAPQYDEQVAIVSVLSDMDAEIAALEHRRDKTQFIKKGMRQQLLTGRVRLMKPELATTQRATQ